MLKLADFNKTRRSPQNNNSVGHARVRLRREKTLSSVLILPAGSLTQPTYLSAAEG